MSRISSASLEQYVPLFGAGASPTMRVYANAPETALAVSTLGTVMSTGGVLPFRLIELVRLRIAFHNQCRVCMAQRYTDGAGDTIDEGLVCSLEKPHEAADLTESERSALAFADRMATDHLSVSDETFDELRRHYSNAELMDLCFHIAWYVGFGRMNAVLEVDPSDAPEHFSTGAERLTPWAPTTGAVVGTAR